MRRRSAWAVALALLLFSGWSDANAIRRSSSFVAPTKGSAHSLTLTTYVTDAADFHYATVRSGHAPLDATAIKSASADGIVHASTDAVDRAQKLERLIDGLEANASYDVYFVAEVPHSNGVYGPVLSVMGTTTHPSPPAIVTAVAAAANASATAVAVNLTLSSLGVVHVAFLPSSNDDIELFTVEDVIARRDQGLRVVFATENRFRWDALSVQSIISDMAPATELDMLFVTEATGNGAVFSELIRYKRAVQTHAAAPDIEDLTCWATKASSSSLDLSYRLQFAPEDVDRAAPENLQRYQFDVLYEIFKEAANGSVTSAQRGSVRVGPFERVEDLLRRAVNVPLNHSVGDLDFGTVHDVTVHVETLGSHGVVGQSQSVQQCRTHALAPDITKAHAFPVNSTVSALQVEVELKHSGNVHYVLAPRAASTELRNAFLQARHAGELAQTLQEATDRPQYRTGIIAAAGSDSSEPIVETCIIEDLEENSPFAIVVIPETTNSFGVFGTPFATLLEATTNEKASDVSVIAVQPTHGSVTSIDVRVAMSKPTDLLFVCWKSLQGEEDCREVPRDELEKVHQSPQGTELLHRIGDLSEDTEYQVSVFTESHVRNGVRSERTASLPVKTSRQAPQLLIMNAQAIDGRVDAARLHIELSEPGIVHYAIVEVAPDGALGTDAGADAAGSLSAEAIIDESKYSDHAKSNVQHDPLRHSSRDLPRNNQNSRQFEQSQQSRNSVVKRGHVFTHDTRIFVIVDELRSNTTYSIHAVTESSLGNDLESSSSGVYGAPTRANTTTHDVAPVIVKATAHPSPGRTDRIDVSVNISRPGIVHYALTDTDFADPATIKRGLPQSNVEPHVVRGTFIIDARDMATEIKNGTNDTQPMDPLVFANNFTIGNLREDTTYHLSLTTETRGSNGVFGGFPAPILVTTHESPPQIESSSLFIGPVGDASTDVSIRFRLDKFGDVHYAIFFRGIVRDLTTDAAEEEEQKRLDEQEVAAEAHARMNEGKNSTEKIKPFEKIPRWPPPISEYELSRLSPRAVKEASFEELQEGVWENGTISVSRDDVFRKKLMEEKIEKLPPNAIFDVCLVPETAASDGVFASLTCHRVKTHADYSNQSVAFDDINVQPVLGTKDAVRVELFISKLLEGSDGGDSPDEGIHRLERVAGRVPYFILVDGQEGRPEFAHNTFSSPSHSHRHDRTVSPFKTAVPGRGSVVETGVLDSITFENDTFVAVERVITGLRDNHRYFFFFAYETAHSDGVFTKVNPHKHRPNETDSRNAGAQAIEVVTFEQAPRVKRYEVRPTYGDTGSVTVNVDVEYASGEDLVLHLLVVNEGCPPLSPSILLPRESELETIESSGLLRDEPCHSPLVYRRVEVNMTERNSANYPHNPHSRQHYRSNEAKAGGIEEVILSEGVLLPNTTYQVMIATETYGSGGVISERVEVVSVTTFPLAPRFNELKVLPRKGSTTELIMVLELEYPGEIHYMIGKSGNPDLNVTSPYNISAKSLPGQRDSKFHDYDRDIVRLRRSVKVERVGETHFEVIDYLVAGTSYDVFVVAETGDDSGIYGEVFTFYNVSTFATPPMLLAHAAYPTPGRTDSLTVGFRVEEATPCWVHMSVITSTLWRSTAKIAAGSDAFGNRLAMDDRFIDNTSILIDGHSKDDWREVNLSVPLAGTNYTVFLVTETLDSDGVFGTVATHPSVRSHREPPMALNVSVRATDARVDALTVELGLNHDEGAHIHYAVLRHRQRFTRSAIATVGQVNVTSSNATSFVVEGLQGRTTYDIYLRLETLESGGVVGEWSAFPLTGTTHGLPAEVLESVECDVSPTCDSIGRHPCSHVANVCGECLDGFDGMTGSSNTACEPLDSGKVGPTIKISGVRINPRRRRPHHDDDVNDPSSFVLETERSGDDVNDVVSVALEVESPANVDAEVMTMVDTAVEPPLVDIGDHDNASCLPTVENPLLAMMFSYASRAR